jgi:hypothetical protein
VPGAAVVELGGDVGAVAVVADEAGAPTGVPAADAAPGAAGGVLTVAHEASSNTAPANSAELDLQDIYAPKKTVNFSAKPPFYRGSRRKLAQVDLRIKRPSAHVQWTFPQKAIA